MGAAILRTFCGEKIKSVLQQQMRMNTGDNERFLRLWYEVSAKKMFRGNRWIPFSKGGEYRKWYGNLEYVLDYLDNGKGFKECQGYRGSDESNYFKEGIVWSDISSANVSFRYLPSNCIAGAAGPMLGLVNNRFSLSYLLGFLNSKVSNQYAKLLCPTLHFQWGDIQKFPILFNSSKGEYSENVTYSCVSLEKDDWDSYETSWDFKRNPLV